MMSAADSGNEDEETLTLAFSIEALEAVERPQSVFADARTWSQHVGIISRDPRAGERYAREYGLAQDFFTGDHGKHESLALVERQFRTDRHVLVGASDDDRRVADAAGWEFLPIEEAAAKADWDLASPDGLLDRLARYVADWL